MRRVGVEFDGEGFVVHVEGVTSQAILATLACVERGGVA